MHRNNKIALSLLFLIFILIIQIMVTRFPSFFFEKRMSYNNISVYSDKTIDTIKLKNILEKTIHRLKESSYYEETNIKLVFCNNKWVYSFITPFNYSGLATNYIGYGNIFVSSINLNDNISKSFFNSYHEDLDKLLAHEITHSFLYENKMDKIPKWMNEGYCEYIAYSGENTLEYDLKKFNDENDIYSKYRLLISYLIKNCDMSLEEIANKNLNEDVIFEEIKKNNDNLKR